MTLEMHSVALWAIRICHGKLICSTGGCREAVERFGSGAEALAGCCSIVHRQCEAAEAVEVLLWLALVLPHSSAFVPVTPLHNNKPTLALYAKKKKKSRDSGGIGRTSAAAASSPSSSTVKHADEQIEFSESFKKRESLHQAAGR